MEPGSAPHLYHTLRTMLLCDRLCEAKDILDANPEFLEMCVGGESLLHFCVIENCIEAVRFLLQRGANVEQREEYDDETPLLDSIALPSIDMLALLLSHGADPNVRSCVYGWALEFALEERNCGAVSLLLSNGANPNMIDNCEERIREICQDR